MALVEHERTDEGGSPEALIREARELQRRRRRRRAAAAVVGLLALGGGIVLAGGSGGAPVGPGLVGPLPPGIAARASPGRRARVGDTGRTGKRLDVRAARAAARRPARG